MAIDFNKGVRPNVYELMQGGGSGYELPPATEDTLGGVKIGRGVDVDEDGTISVTAPAPIDTYTKEEIDEQQEAQDYNINSNALAISRLETALDDTYTKAEIDEQQQEQDANIANNAAAISSAQSAISNIQTEQVTQNTNISVNAQSILSLQNDVHTIQGQQTAQDENIANNSADIVTLQNEISSLQTDYYTKAEVDAQQQTQDTAISINAGNIATLQNNVQTIQGQQTTQDTNIATNAANISTLQTDLNNETTARYDADTILQNNINANTAAINDLSTQIADDSTLGLIKTDSANNIATDANGVLEIGGRLGQFPNGGVFYPTTIEPTLAGPSTFMLTDGAKYLSLGGRTFGIMAGVNLTCKSAAAGTTQYRLSNNQSNRFACFACRGGRLAIDQTDATENGTALITDISFANGNPISAYFGTAESRNDIIITVDRTVNPNTATTKLRMYGTSTSTDVIIVGQGNGASGGKAISLGQACHAGGNQCIAFGNSSLSLANNSVALGHTHIVDKQFCFAAGQGHDFTSGSNGAGAVGIASEITSDTAFAVGNGIFNANGNITRSNALEVKNDGSIVLKSPDGTKYKISVDNNGNLVTTQL